MFKCFDPALFPGALCYTGSVTEDKDRTVSDINYFFYCSMRNNLFWSKGDTIDTLWTS